MTMPTQAQDTQTIRPQECKEMLTPRMKLQKQCELRYQAIREQLAQEPERTKDKQKEPYVKGMGMTEIKQLVARHPELPDETELRREDRKNWQK